MTATVQTFYRLAWLDERLATIGVCAMRDAKFLNTNAKTVRRDLDFLHELSPLVYQEEERGRKAVVLRRSGGSEYFPGGLLRRPRTELTNTLCLLGGLDWKRGLPGGRFPER